ncbi:MAG: hypothetical protein AAF790_07320, partial [Planctomycetota bacterium]
MRMLGVIIGYFCTATVLSATIGMAYLWRTQRLDDEKVFRIVALVHDVDIDSLAEEQQGDAAATPDEEPSPDDVARYQA